MKRIILVRHGRSAHVHEGWLDSAQLNGWQIAYDRAGLAQGEVAPAPLRELAAGVGRVVASDLPRAIESAALIAPHAAVEQSILLRETPLLIPALGRVRLPLAIWGVLIGVRWLRDMTDASRETHAAPRARSQQAAQWLDTLADTHGSVLVVTHGAIRRYLADALESRGWHGTPARRRFHHWSAWELTR